MLEKEYEVILDESNQMIQVATLDTYEMMYANKPAIEYTNHNQTSYKGQKCYKYMMGLDEQCPFCPMLLMEKGDVCKVSEVDNGKQVYKVKTVITKWKGKDAFIEYATDVTLARRAQEIYSNDMSRLLNSIPEARGIFHLNLTNNTNKCLRSETIIDNVNTVDELIKKISLMISSVNDVQKFLMKFERNKLIEAFKQGKNDVVMEVVSNSIDGENHWFRITARNIVNPSNGDLESFLYVLDVSTEKNLEELASRDALTGLYNKKFFQTIVTSKLENYHDYKKALVFIDIDHFKIINDTFGHLVGDMVICNVANKLQSIFSDLDIIARFGGDEFCIYLENISNNKLIEKLQRFQDKLNDSSDNVGFTCSIGIAFKNNNLNDYKQLLDRADRALYQAKMEGRNKIIID